MTVSVTPQSAPLDQRFTVAIQLLGNSKNCGQSVVVKPVDVYQVLDHSGSMGDNDKMAKAIQAATAFLHEMDFPTDRVGVVQFDDTAQVLLHLSTDSAAIEATLQTIEVGGGTDVAAGLTAAYEALQTERRPDAIPVIIVLSDGQSNASAIKHAADTAKADGVVVVAIGLGNDVDENAMQGMASFTPDGKTLYFFAPDPSQLEAIYQSIAKAIRTYALAQNFTLQVETDVYKFKILPDSLQPAGKVAGDTISWEQSLLDDGTTTFKFQVSGRNPGTYPVGKIIRASFLECEQNERELTLQDVPIVQATQIQNPPPAPLLCSRWQTFPWWAIPPLVLLLLLAGFAGSAPGRRLLRRMAKKPVWCKVLSILLLLTILAFLALLTRALTGNLCPNDALYFWKLTASGDVGIYRTRFAGNTISEARNLNRASNCVACHQVSGTQLIAAVQDDHNGNVTIIHHKGQGVPIPPVKASYLDWSPDGSQLALSYNDADIYILNLSTGDLNPLPGANDPNVVETMPAWSPDGKTIAFVRAERTAPPPKTAEIDVPCDIYTVPAEGGQSLPLPGASGDGFNYYPTYSPDGKWLAFTRHTNGENTYADNAADIYIIPAAGAQDPVRLNINSEAADSWPSWSPDSKWLGFSSNRSEGQFDIFVTPIGKNGLPYALEYDEQGNRSAIFKIEAAALSEDEEFHPVWLPSQQANRWERVRSLWPWVIPLVLLPLLLRYVCRERQYIVRVQVIDGLTGEPIPESEVRFTYEGRQDD